MTTISEFKGPYAFLSNFYQSPVNRDLHETIAVLAGFERRGGVS